MNLRRRVYLDDRRLDEALTIAGTEFTGQRILGQFRTLAQRLKGTYDERMKLKAVVEKQGKELLALAKSISTKKTLWQKVRGY